MSDDVFLGAQQAFGHCRLQHGEDHADSHRESGNPGQSIGGLRATGAMPGCGEEQAGARQHGQCVGEDDVAREAEEQQGHGGPEHQIGHPAIGCSLTVRLLLARARQP
ncbi:hypothetical protein D9M68_754010 [compost metagenome]